MFERRLPWVAGWAGSRALLGGIVAGAGPFVTPAGAAPPSCTQGKSKITCTFSSGRTDWLVPSGVTRVTIVAFGAEGGPGETGRPRAGGGGGGASDVRTGGFDLADRIVVAGGGGGGGVGFSEDCIGGTGGGSHGG